MPPTDPYAKLGGGALDQELFKQKPTPPPTHADDTSDSKTYRSKKELKSSEKTPSSPTKERQRKRLTMKNVSKQGRKVISKEGSNEVNIEERILASLQTTDLKANTFRYTQEELDFIRDVVYEAEVKYKTKLDKNDVARIGLEWLKEDWKTNNEESLLARILTSKKARR